MALILLGPVEPALAGQVSLLAHSLGCRVQFVPPGHNQWEVLASLRELVLALLDGSSAMPASECRDDVPVFLLQPPGVAPAPTPRSVPASQPNVRLVRRPVEWADLERLLRAAISGPSTRWRAGATQQRLERVVRQVAPLDVPVLILGETGVGKEVLARRLHELSPRRAAPFLKLNCAALPSELIESELFGYERGAFTGAAKRTPGKFELAHGGTILLDEIGEMDFRLQSKLLHVLQDHEYHPLGSRDLVRVDVRVLAATHADLETAMAEHRFREDLFYRLNVVPIEVPPLRERQDEILPLARHFLQKYASAEPPPPIPEALERALLSHCWPGNIRELENVARKYLVFRDATLLAEELASTRMRRTPTAPLTAPATAAVTAPPLKPSPLASVAQANQKAESETILAALERTRWNRRRAADLLEIDYKALLYKMKKIGIAPN